MNTYVQGTLVRLTSLIASVAGTLTDPTTVVLKIKTPDQVITDLSAFVVKDSVGNYHCDFTSSQVGLHQCEWLCAGNAVVNGVDWFQVTAGL